MSRLNQILDEHLADLSHKFIFISKYPSRVKCVSPHAAGVFAVPKTSLIDFDASIAPHSISVTKRGGLGASCQRRVLDYIEAHLTEEIDLDQLAQKAGHSPNHFSKAFKISLGVPPWRYVTERRIHRAKELLLNGSSSITEIAHDLGFSSHSHFTDVFRKATGKPPSHFRRD